MIETYEVKNSKGETIEEVDYNTETMQIDEIRLWSESAQAFRPTSVWQFRAQQPLDFERLETKIVEHEANRLLEIADTANEFKFWDLRGVL